MASFTTTQLLCTSHHFEMRPNDAAAKQVNQRRGIGYLLAVLSSKAESVGRQVIAVDPRRASQRCAECGHTNAGDRVAQAAFQCLACGHQAHADVNAAQNTLRAGLALQEA